jgi:histidinol-phosphate aminotransferase
MSVLDLARRELLALKGYSSARMEAGYAHTMLNANESPWSLLDDDALKLNRYPDPQPRALREKLATLHGVHADQVLIGRGSDEPIDLLTRAFCRAGEDAIVVSPPTFAMYAVSAGVQGARVLEVPLDVARGFKLDPYRVIGRALTEEAKIVYLCSPNNPTGALVPRTDLLGVIDALSGHALVVVDEAYIEFSDAPSLARELHRYPHLAILRTFSKAYGLAGARLGLLLAHAELIALLRKLMAPYPLPQASIAALDYALSAEGQARVATRIALLKAERARVLTGLQSARGVREVLPSDANFLTFRAADAAALLQHFADAGIVLRDARKYVGLNDALRVSIGSAVENDRLLDALENAP